MYPYNVSPFETRAVGGQNKPGTEFHIKIFGNTKFLKQSKYKLSTTVFGECRMLGRSGTSKLKIKESEDKV